MGLYLGKEKINNISVGKSSSGLDTSDATATANDMAKGKTAYVNGEKITGTLLSIAPTAPSISIDAMTGLITATTRQYNTGIISFGESKTTKQLPVRRGTTITPTTSDQSAVNLGTYTLGSITVKGDTNLVPANIKKGTSIFGVTGTYDGSNSTPSDYFTIGSFNVVDGYQDYISWEVPSFADAFTRIEIFPIGNTFINDDSSLIIDNSSGEDIRTLLDNKYGTASLAVILNFTYYRDNFSDQNPPIVAITYYDGGSSTVKFLGSTSLQSIGILDPEEGTLSADATLNTVLLAQLFPDTIKYGVLYHN